MIREAGICPRVVVMQSRTTGLLIQDGKTNIFTLLPSNSHTQKASSFTRLISSLHHENTHTHTISHELIIHSLTHTHSSVLTQARLPVDH